MNRDATRKTIEAIEQLPQHFNNHEFGTAPVLDILDGRNITEPMSLASWVVVANGERAELMRRLYDDQGSMECLIGTDLIYHIHTTITEYACDLLGLEPLERAVLTAAVWPESWWSEHGFLCYTDRLMTDIQPASPTPANVSVVLRRMLDRDSLSDHARGFCICERDQTWHEFDQKFRAVLVEPSLDWTMV